MKPENQGTTKNRTRKELFEVLSPVLFFFALFFFFFFFPFVLFFVAFVVSVFILSRMSVFFLSRCVFFGPGTGRDGHEASSRIERSECWQVSRMFGSRNCTPTCLLFRIDLTLFRVLLLRRLRSWVNPLGGARVGRDSTKVFLSRAPTFKSQNPEHVNP